MYQTVAPALSAVRAGPVRELPLRLETALTLRFGAGQSLADEGLDRYFGDLVTAYGRDREWAALGGARATSYTSMAAGVLAALAPRVGRLDHIVLAHATPDIDCWTSVGCYLAERAPGGPLVFCVSDQGVAAPFTALRMAGELARDTPAAGRSMVLVLDQRTVPWPVERPELVPERDTAVALILRPAPPGRGMRLGQHTDVAPEAVPGHLTETLTSTPAALIAGPRVPLTAALRARTRPAPAGGVCTSVWADLPGSGGLVVAEYDPELRYLCTATLEAAP